MKRTRKKQDGNVQYIENLNLRNVTYCKRKRGFIKKAMELSILCGQQISLMIYDSRKNKLVTYNTDDFSHQKALEINLRHLAEKNKKMESYTDKDYNHFVVNQSIEDTNNPFLIFNVENCRKVQNDDCESSLMSKHTQQETPAFVQIDKQVPKQPEAKKTASIQDSAPDKIMIPPKLPLQQVEAQFEL